MEHRASGDAIDTQFECVNLGVEVAVSTGADSRIMAMEAFAVFRSRLHSFSRCRYCQRLASDAWPALILRESMEVRQIFQTSHCTYRTVQQRLRESPCLVDADRAGKRTRSDAVTRLSRLQLARAFLISLRDGGARLAAVHGYAALASRGRIARMLLEQLHTLVSDRIGWPHKKRFVPS
jgi:hypothetical protein